MAKNIGTQSDWFIVIAREPGGYYRADMGTRYNFYRKYAKRNNWDVVAEERELTNDDMTRITGYDEHGEESGEHHLDQLVESFNLSDDSNPQQELTMLCSRLRVS